MSHTVRVSIGCYISGAAVEVFRDYENIAFVPEVGDLVIPADGYPGFEVTSRTLNPNGSASVACWARELSRSDVASILKIPGWTRVSE